jgi:predicted amidohydrolase
MCQITCLDGDRTGNLARIEYAIRDARRQNAELVCLPEMAIYGWVNPQAHGRAHPIPGADADQLCELARGCDVYVCSGLAEKADEALHDAAVLLDPEGRILLKHRKINLLSELMTPPYAPGRDIDVVETPLGRIGLLICADTHESSLLARMAGQHPDLVLVPYGYAAEQDAWPAHGLVLERVVTHAARTIGAPVVGTNLIGQITHGPWAGRTYAGHSVAANGSGEVVARGADFDRDIVTFTISL